MDFNWYEYLEKSDNLTQGDILKSCPIPLLNNDFFSALLNDNDEEVEIVDINTCDIIILSQACDIQNSKIDSLVVCPVWPLNALINSNPYFKSSKGRESLRQGKEPAYHLLDEVTKENFKMQYSVVDFHRIYSLPKSYLLEFTLTLTNRLRVLPPYREHLSQAFARYFMRVGLPTDINRDSIKNFS